MIMCMCCEGTWFLVGLRLNNKYLGKIKRILRCAPTLRPQDFPKYDGAQALFRSFLGADIRSICTKSAWARPRMECISLLRFVWRPVSLWPGKRSAPKVLDSAHRTLTLPSEVDPIWWNPRTIFWRARVLLTLETFIRHANWAHISVIRNHFQVGVGILACRTLGAYRLGIYPWLLDAIARWRE